MIEDRLPFRGWGPFREEWYSVCSRHYHHVPVCRACCSGHWVNCWAHAVSYRVYDRFPRAWRFFSNLKSIDLQDFSSNGRASMIFAVAFLLLLGVLAHAVYSRSHR